MYNESKFIITQLKKCFQLAPNGKAHNNGVSLGDILVAVNGEYVENLSPDFLMEKLQENNEHLHLVLERFALSFLFYRGLCVVSLFHCRMNKNRLNKHTKQKTITVLSLLLILRYKIILVTLFTN